MEDKLVEILSFKGTVEEFKAIAPHLFEASDAAEMAVGVTLEKELDQEGHSVDPFIYRLLTRLPIPPGQIALYRALYQAGDHWLSATELAAAMNRPIDKLNGVLGALGRRVNETPGVSGKPGINVLLDLHNADNKWYYRMKPELRHVLEELGIVQANDEIAS